MGAGDYRHKITIQKPDSAATNECGEEIPGFVDFATVWAAAEPLQGREYFEAQKIRPEMTYRFRLRYLAGVTQDMRVLFNNRVFDIRSVINVDEKNRELQLICLERAQNV